jgi:hypothetical protein
MGLWKRIRDWFRGSDEQLAEQALREREKPQGEEGLPPHFEEVVQPRQYPPTGSGPTGP